MYDFGLRLKKLRKSRGLTQKMLADRINKSVSAVGSYESNAQLTPRERSALFLHEKQPKQKDSSTPIDGEVVLCEKNMILQI